MDSFEKALTEHQQSLMGFAHSLARSTSLADDLVQNTLLQALSKRHLFEEGTNMKSWLFTILRNGYFSILRKRKNEQKHLDFEILRGEPLYIPQEEILEYRETLEYVDQLPTEQREAIIAVGLEGYSYEDAAAMYDTPVGTIKSRLSRARERLRQQMKTDRGVNGSAAEEWSDQEQDRIFIFGESFEVEKKITSRCRGSAPRTVVVYRLT